MWSLLCEYLKKKKQKNLQKQQQLVSCVYVVDYWQYNETASTLTRLNHCC